jgi:hypothetical protein
LGDVLRISEPCGHDNPALPSLYHLFRAVTPPITAGIILLDLNDCGVGVFLGPRHVTPNGANGFATCARWDLHRAAGQDEHRQHCQH